MAIYNAIAVVLFLMFTSAMGIFWLLDFKEAMGLSSSLSGLSFCMLLGGIVVVVLDD